MHRYPLMLVSFLASSTPPTSDLRIVNQPINNSVRVVHRHFSLILKPFILNQSIHYDNPSASFSCSFSCSLSFSFSFSFINAPISKYGTYFTKFFFSFHDLVRSNLYHDIICFMGRPAFYGPNCRRHVAGTSRYTSSISRKMKLKGSVR